MFLTVLFIQKISIEERLHRRLLGSEKGSEAGTLREAEYDSSAHGAYYGRVHNIKCVQKLQWNVTDTITPEGNLCAELEISGGL